MRGKLETWRRRALDLVNSFIKTPWALHLEGLHQLLLLLLTLIGNASGGRGRWVAPRGEWNSNPSGFRNVSAILYSDIIYKIEIQ